MLIVFPDELAILRGMQPLDRDVFNYLAERVDFDTGVVGEARRVSYGGMAFDLSEPDQARRAKGKLLKLTSRQVRNSVARLVDAGLLDRLSKKGVNCDLVVRRFFWAKALDVSSSVQNPDGRQMADRLFKLAGLFSLNNKELDVKEDFRRQGDNVSDGITSLQLLQQGDVERFVMFLEWQPSQDELDMIFHRAGVDKSKIKPEWVSEFVAHWWGEGKRCYNQREWTARFGAKMVDFLRNPARFDELRGMRSIKPVSAGAEHYPDYARIPRDDALLVPWMRRHGYGDPLPGHDYRQARAHLQRAVDARLSAERGRLS